MSYIKFYFNAKTKFNIHSPFVFQYYKEVLADKRFFYRLRDIDRLRYDFLKYQKPNKTYKKQVKSLDFYWRLWRMLRFFRASSIYIQKDNTHISALTCALATSTTQVFVASGADYIDFDKEPNIHRVNGLPNTAIDFSILQYFPTSLPKHPLLLINCNRAAIIPKLKGISNHFIIDDYEAILIVPCTDKQVGGYFPIIDWWKKPWRIGLW